MRIIYFEGRYQPSVKVSKELYMIQQWMNETNASILVDCKFDKYQYIIRRQQLANRLREKWKVIQGCKPSINPDLEEVI